MKKNNKNRKTLSGGTPFGTEKFPPHASLEPGTARSAGQSKGICYLTKFQLSCLKDIIKTKNVAIKLVLNTKISQP